MQDYESVCVAVMIYATLVNILTHRPTHSQAGSKKDSFRPVVLLVVVVVVVVVLRM